MPKIPYWFVALAMLTTASGQDATKGNPFAAFRPNPKPAYRTTQEACGGEHRWVRRWHVRICHMDAEIAGPLALCFCGRMRRDEHKSLPFLIVVVLKR